MRRYSLLFITILIVSFAYQASTTSGSIELDELNFDKITNKFEVSLIKFDVAFPYGDKHEAFVALAKDSKDVEDLLIAEVGVKDYGEKDNEALAKKYGATKDKFPVVKLFVKGKSEPIPFDDANGFTTDELRRFIRDNSGLYLSLPGCVKEFDKLAIQFMKSKKDERKKILKKSEELKNMDKVYIVHLILS